jgi:hypothetical protein
MGLAKGEAGIQRAATQANLRNQAVTRDDAFTKSLRICHSFSQIRRLSLHQDNRMAATGCLTIESVGAVSEDEWKLICLVSPV